MNGPTEQRRAGSPDDDVRDTDSPRTASYAIVAWLATLLFCVISLAPHGGVAKYRYSFLFLVPIVWGAFALRRRLLLRPLHFALFALALVLHDLGAFGWYSRRFIGLQYDWCVHFFFGLVGGLIVARVLHVKLGLRGSALAILVVLVITGIGGLHEIVESASTMLLGTEYGMLVIGADNPFDTQEDLFSNVLGSSAASALHQLRAGAKRRSAG
jgi:uncharacterized membrane protein YjdF